MLGDSRGSAAVDDDRKEAGVVLWGGNTHVSQDLCDEVVSVLGRLPPGVEGFFRSHKLPGTESGLPRIGQRMVISSLIRRDLY